LISAWPLFRDPATYTIAAGLLLLVALAASIFPGLRAARLLPTGAAP
jgi:ABC-type lipoprotein release transport system permease subunit